MNKRDQNRFDKLYQQYLTELKLKGMAPKTISAYSRVVRWRIAKLFGCSPTTSDYSRHIHYWISGR